MSLAFARPERIHPEIGTVFDGRGTHFSVFSENAEGIELCLFGRDGRDEVRLELPHREGPVFSGYLPGVRPGQLYGYRAHGAYAPEQGHRSIAERWPWLIYAPAHRNVPHLSRRAGREPGGRQGFVAVQGWASTPATPRDHSQEDHPCRSHSPDLNASTPR